MELINVRNHKHIYNGKKCDFLRNYKCNVDKSEPKLRKAQTNRAGHEFESMSPLDSTTEDSKYSMQMEKVGELDYVVIGEQRIDMTSKNSAGPVLYKNLEEFKQEKQHKLEQEELQFDLEDSLDDMILPQPRNQPLSGDILVRIMHKGSMKTPMICRLYFNTAFVLNRTMKFTIKDVDPPSLRTSSKFQSEFYIKIKTEAICKTCTPKKTILSNL